MELIIKTDIRTRLKAFMKTCPKDQEIEEIRLDEKETLEFLDNIIVRNGHFIEGKDYYWFYSCLIRLNQETVNEYSV